MQNCSERQFDGSTDWSTGVPESSASHRVHCAPRPRPSPWDSAYWLANTALVRSACFRIRAVKSHPTDCLLRQLAIRFMRDIFVGANSFDGTFSRTPHALLDFEMSDRMVKCRRRDPR